VIDAMNASGKAVLALDLPSGVDADSGAIPGAAVRADTTVAFGQPKVGSLLFPGRGFGGRLIAVEIGFPPSVEGEAGAALITSEWAERLRPRRPLVTHKKAEGRVLILAGSEGMAGAAILAARGALRAGAGYVRVASSVGNREILQRSLPEAIFVNAEDATTLQEAGLDSDCLLIGPGIGLGEPAAERVNILFSLGGPRSILLDADALTLLAVGRLSNLPGTIPADRRLLTPHPGEMARLQGGDSEPESHSLLAASRRGAEHWNSVLLLKGSPSVVASPFGGPVRVSSTGSSNLARAGMGDLLGGVAAAFMARGLDAADAASLALHSTGRAAALTGKGESLLPSDIAEALSEALNEAPEESDLGFSFVTLDLDPPS
jgi:NAD(P)H-hydrate epimerase